jgi:PAS domain S-box-containing protein
MIEPPRFSRDDECERTEGELLRPAMYRDEPDSSARRQIEALFAGEKRLLEVIAAGGPLATTLEALCCLAEDVDRSSVVSILLVDRSGRFRRGAGPSLPPSYADALNGWPVGLGIGPCAAAAHLDEQVISMDITKDERWSDAFRALGLAHGLRACWSTPIKSSEGRVLGTFAIYPSAPASPTSEQRSRIEQLTHLASIAIERAQSIDALRRSEERYARAMDTAGDGHIEWVVASDEFYASAHFLEMCGFPVDTTFMNRADFLARFPVHPEDRDGVIDAINANLAFASPTDRLERDMRMLRHGETRWHHLTGLCSRDATGALLRWNAAITDITDRKRADEALRQSREGYALAMEASGEGHWDWNIATNEYHLSPRLLALCRFAPGATFKNREDFLARLPLHSEDRPRWEEAIAAHFAGQGARFDIELRVCADGETHWIHITGILSRDASGKPVRWTGAVADITERKHAEEALRRSEAALRVSEERYALALEASEEGHFDIDLQAGEIFVSARVNEIYGSPAQAKTLNRSEFLEQIPFHPDDRPRVLAEVNKHDWNDRSLQETQCRIVLRSGETRWIRSRAKVVRDAQGRARRRVGVLADITEHKRAEEALREQTERLQLGQAAMRMIIMDWNVTEDLITWSDAPEWLRGPLPTSGRYPHFKDQVHPEDRDSFLATRRRALETLQVQTTEFRVVRTDGEVIWVLERKHAFAGADGKPVRMLAAMFDITERKRAEDELRESEARFRGLTALWSDWYWRQDEHLRFTYSSATTDPPDGYPGGKAIGKTRWELPGIVPLSNSWAEHRELLAARKAFRDFEYSRPAADGTVRYVSTSGTPIFDEKGEFRGYHGVARDITERKRVEEELRSHREMLEVAQKAARAAAFEWPLVARPGSHARDCAELV